MDEEVGDAGAPTLALSRRRAEVRQQVLRATAARVLRDFRRLRIRVRSSNGIDDDACCGHLDVRVDGRAGARGGVCRVPIGP